MKLLKFLWIAIMLTVAVKPVMADDNQPRFMLPNLDIQNLELYGYAAVTEQNPCFTIYLWYGNSDMNDSYWTDAPTITIDGKSIKLEGVQGNQKENLKLDKEWMCYDDDKLYYTIHGHDPFEAKKNKVFYNTYKGSEGFNNSPNFDDDWYVILDVYIRENVDSAKHKVSVKGLCCIDGNKKDNPYSAKNEFNNDTIITGKTICPFEYFDQNTKLAWSAPHKLTYTTASFKQKRWGKYQAIFDGSLQPEGHPEPVRLGYRHAEGFKIRYQEAGNRQSLGIFGKSSTHMEERDFR